MPPLFSSTTDGWPYIAGTQNANLIDDYALELANKLDAVVPYAQASGVASITGTTLASGASTFVAVTLPASRFSVAPNVVATVASAQASTAFLVCRVLNITTTGFNAYIYNVSSGSVTFSGSLLVNWIATQMNTGSASG